MSAAVRLAGAGRRVVVHELARHAGGRCRSFFEPALGLNIDNGNHLVLSGNKAALGLLKTLGSESKLSGPGEAEFAFADLASGERWLLRPNQGRLPWWIFSKSRRVPNTRAVDYLGLARLLTARPDQTVGDVIDCKGTLYERLWLPLLLAALNTDPPGASAQLAGAIVRETLARGGAACRPLIGAVGLGPAFIDPALAFLDRHGATIRFDHQLRRLDLSDDMVRALDFGEDRVTLDRGDTVVLAMPAWVAPLLVPGLAAPTEFRAIANAHFAIRPPERFPRILGVINGTTEWLFAFADRLSVTISAADRFNETPREEFARSIWAEVAALTGLSEPHSPHCQLKTRSAQAPGHGGATSWSRVIGPQPGCQRPSRDRSAPATGPPSWCPRSSPDKNGRINRRRTLQEMIMGQAEALAGAVNSRATGAQLDASISLATRALLDTQQADGHFVFELEADATIPAEYVLMRHYLGEPVDAALEAKIAVYLRRIQSTDGGWPLFHEGASNMSASVKAYFALKVIGDPVDAHHMMRARQWILGHGGAATSNVFTRNLLALYGAIPWRGVPVMPVEIMLLPRWFPFHLDKVSYWARTVLVPLTVLNALRPQARNPKGVRINELFVTPPDEVRHWPKGPHQRWPWAQVFGGIDRVLRVAEPYFPRATRKRAIHGERDAHVRGFGISSPPCRLHHGSDVTREAAGYQG